MIHYGIDPRKSPKQIKPIAVPAFSQNQDRTTIQSWRQRMNQNNSMLPQVKPSLRSHSSMSSPLSQPTMPNDEISSIFDRMCGSTIEAPLHVAIEAAVQELVKANKCILWVALPPQKILYSPTLQKVTSFDSSIVGFAYSNNESVKADRPAMHNSYDLVIDEPDSPSMYFPIVSKRNNVLAVVQAIRNQAFSDSQFKMLAMFINKFTFYAHLLFDDEFENEVTADLFVVGNSKKNVIDQLIAQLKTYFKCREVEFFSMTERDKTYYKYDSNIGDFSQLQDTAGAVSFVLKNKAPLNLPNVTDAPGYCPFTDGRNTTSFLSLPIKIQSDGTSVAIVLRDKDGGKSFSSADFAYLLSVIPIISKSIILSGSEEGVQVVNNTPQVNVGDEDVEIETENYSSSMEERLRALLSVAECLSGVMDIDVLIPTIMEKACALLNTERCSLFIVDTVKQELVSCFQGGLDKRLRIPMNRGIVGVTATKGTIVNIADAYNDPRFDRSVDIKTGFKTRNLLTVPIYNNRGEIAGVTEMINKQDGEGFDDEDIKILMAFNVFCGISLDNTKLYQSSLDLTRQLRSFVQMSSSLNTTKTLSDVLTGILNNAQEVIHASRASIFMYDIDNTELNLFTTIGEGESFGTTFAQEAIDKRAICNFTSEEVTFKLRANEIGDEPTAEGRKLSSGSDSSKQSLSRVTSVLGVGISPFDSNNSLQMEMKGSQLPNIVNFPLLASDSRLLGVMELTCSWRITPEDIKLLDCFAVFASVSLERSELQEIAKVGALEANLRHYIADSERKETTIIPEKLKLASDKSALVNTINFDAPMFDGMGHFKVLFQIFNEFKLLELFKITNEKFFKFLTGISETYNKVPYHNWRHAVDVTQFVNYELHLTKLYEKLTKQELLGLLVASICHDANHDGFTNVYNEKAETPLGILFKNQSVMETHHCSVAISIISKEETNVFSALDSDEYKQMWTMIIRLILSTDMAKHFDFLKETNARLDNGPLNFEDPADRFTAMDLHLKCADISNVSRPFEMANKWCDVLCEEFFRQGDLEMTNGMEYTSPLNDRAHLDKPKSQIGFYTFVCLPLYQTAARAFSELQVNVDQVQSNLEIWKAATEAGTKA